LSYLAATPEGESSVSEIAAAERISAKYLEGIVSILKSAGLVMSVRGKNGGYHLARDPSTITMLEVVRALDGAVAPVVCVGKGGGCVNSPACLPRRFWVDLKESIDDFLEKRTLKDIVDQGGR
jgi:Rrf2 family transcriptional regulator, cysteine metabolism repressor